MEAVGRVPESGSYPGPMRPARPPRNGVLWDIAVPSRPGRLAGVTMAGFSDPANELVEVEMVPHPAVSLIFNLGDDPFVVVDGRGRQQRERVVAGLAPSGVRGQGLAGSFECLQVRLTPLAAHAVLGASPELSGGVFALDDLWGPEAVELQERLRETGSWDERFGIVEAVLARRRDKGPAVDPAVAVAWRTMLASRGQVRVESLAAEVGLSRKRLWSRFRSQIGLTPKRAAQLVRFDHAAHLLAAGQSAALVAAETGYADQSHLHRDVRGFAGLTPTAVAVAPWLAIDDVAWPGTAPSTSA